MSERYRVALVGCGGISRRHAKGLGEHPQCEIVALADVRPENAAVLGREIGVGTQYTDYGELLERERPDVVAISTWPGTHAEITIAAAEAGARGILCEKPIARSLEELDAMLAACDRAGTKLAVGHHTRYVPAVATARQLIAAGAIGQPTLLRVHSEGGLLNNGSHRVDTLRYLMGDAAGEWVLGQVERRTDRYERGEPIEDLCGAIIAFSNGARAVLESDTPRAEGSYDTLIVGSEGALRQTREGWSLLNGAAAGWQPVEAQPTTPQHEEFIQWLDGETDACRTDAHDNRFTFEILMALYESARTRALVNLPLAGGPSPLNQMIDSGDLPVQVPGKYDIRAK